MQQPQSTLLPVVARRRSKRSALVALVVAPIAASALVASCSSGPTYSLDEALKPRANELGATFQNIISYGDSQTQVSGAVNAAGDRAQMTLDLGGGLFGGAPIQAFIDVPKSVIYMSSDFMKSLGATVDAPWVKVDKATLAAAGQDTSFFDQLKIDDPRNTTSLFANAKSTKDLGMATLPDEDPMRHYQVTVASKDVLAKNPTLKQTIDNLEGTLPDDIVYDVYVTKKNAIRNITFSLDLKVTTLKSELWIDERTDPVVIDFPADGDTVDINDITGPTDTAP